MSGLEMDTKTEDIYLALLQAIACGTGTILESLSGQGVEIRRVLERVVLQRKILF